MPDKQHTILVISPIHLMPVAGGGAARILAYVDFLRQSGFRVELATIPHKPEDEKQLRQRVDGLWIARRKALNTNDYPLLLKHITGALPENFKEQLRPIKRAIDKLKIQRKINAANPQSTNENSFIAQSRNPLLGLYAKQIAEEINPVAVIANFVWTARALEGLPENVLRIIDTIDIQHLRHAIAKDAGYELLRTMCTREEEIEELNFAHTLMAIQKEEQAELQKMCPDKKCILVEHAYAIPKTHTPSPPASKTIMFVGNLYEPNVIGINSFIDAVWPQIQKAVPGAKLKVIGKVCGKTHKEKGVERLGVVPDLEPYYREAAVVINPVPFGSGLKIKSVEALVQGKCLVATEAGTLGLPKTEYSAYITCVLESMSEVILDLLQNQDKRTTFENDARALAIAYYSPEKTYAALLDAINVHIDHLPSID